MHALFEEIQRCLSCTNVIWNFNINIILRLKESKQWAKMLLHLVISRERNNSSKGFVNEIILWSIISMCIDTLELCHLCKCDNSNSEKSPEMEETMFNLHACQLT